MLHWFFAVWEQIHTPLGNTHETAQKMVTAGFMKVKLDFEKASKKNFRNKLNGTQYINMVSKWKCLLLTMLQNCKITLNSREILKGIVHPKMKMWCLSAYRVYLGHPRCKWLCFFSRRQITQTEQYLNHFFTSDPPMSNRPEHIHNIQRMTHQCVLA